MVPLGRRVRANGQNPTGARGAASAMRGTPAVRRPLIRPCFAAVTGSSEVVMVTSNRSRPGVRNLTANAYRDALGAPRTPVDMRGPSSPAARSRYRERPRNGF